MPEMPTIMADLQSIHQTAPIASEVWQVVIRWAYSLSDVRIIFSTRKTNQRETCAMFLMTVMRLGVA